VSLAAGRGLTLVPQHWIWLLGLLPLGLGTRKLVIAIRARRSGGQAAAAASGLPGVIAITIANGGDNLAAYTPVFATISVGATAVTIAVFAAGCRPMVPALGPGPSPTTASPRPSSAGATGSSQPSTSSSACTSSTKPTS
jgi:cadmium resistance protein CadD (predicted permease)